MFSEQLGKEIGSMGSNEYGGSFAYYVVEEAKIKAEKPKNPVLYLKNAKKKDCLLRKKLSLHFYRVEGMERESGSLCSRIHSSDLCLNLADVQLNALLRALKQGSRAT